MTFKDTRGHYNYITSITVFVHGPGLAIMNPHTKFDVYKFNQYENTKANAKCGIWSGLGG